MNAVTRRTHANVVNGSPLRSALPRESLQPLRFGGAAGVSDGDRRCDGASRRDGLHRGRRHGFGLTEQRSRLHAGRRGLIAVQRVAQHEHDLTFGLRERDPFRVAGRHHQRHDVRRRGRSLVVEQPASAVFLTGARASSPGRCSRPSASRCRSRWRIVTIRSTRLPGSMNPATPITSFTFTEIARMPRGMAEGRPRAAFARRQLGGHERLVLEHGRDAAGDSRRR